MQPGAEGALGAHGEGLPCLKRATFLYLERISHGLQHLTCGLSCYVDPNGGIGAGYRHRGSRQSLCSWTEPLPHCAQLVPYMWIGYIAFEGGQKSPKSSQRVKVSREASRAALGREHKWEGTPVEGVGGKRMWGQEPPGLCKDQPKDWQGLKEK